MNSIGTRLFSWLRGDLVGSDEFGNRYYREKGVTDPKKGRRWVMYAAEVDASRVPAEWHGWLHRTTDTPPDPNRPKRPWQIPHIPNTTGTAEAYRPPGHEYMGGRRAKATGDYEPWTPS